MISRITDANCEYLYVARDSIALECSLNVIIISQTHLEEHEKLKSLTSGHVFATISDYVLRLALASRPVGWSVDQMYVT